MSKVKYYIIGPQHHWEINRTAVIQMGVSVAVVFLALIILPFYQFFIHENITTALDDAHEIQNSLSQKLAVNSSQLQQQVFALQKELHETSDSLTTLQTTQHTNSQTQLGFQEKIFEYQLEINDLNLMIKNKDLQIKTLEDQQQKYLQDAQSLSEQLQELESQLNKYSSTSATSSNNTDRAVFVDQLQIASDKNNFTVRFNLRNNTTEALNGYVRILPLTAEQLNQKIKFDSKNTIPFSIIRFLPFSKILQKPKQDSYIAVRIIVWEENKTILFNQNFLIP